MDSTAHLMIYTHTSSHHPAPQTQRFLLWWDSRQWMVGTSGDRKFSDQHYHSIHTSIHIPQLAVLHHRHRGFCCVETPDDGWWERLETGGSLTLCASSSKQSRWASTFWSMMCSFHRHLLWTVMQNWTPLSQCQQKQLAQAVLVSEQALACNSFVPPLSYCIH